ncbi:MAG: Flagellin N-methylase [Methanoregulaceae archaeon PtaB.Bin056]|nr:MAG: Flagellin N-methylase [Methanoregulaceae archaeon PtaB.Bin056]
MREHLATKDEESLAARLQEIGFSCTRCGECCRQGAGDDNLVMVSPAEIRRISSLCQVRPEEYVEPYPERVKFSDGTEITFGWAIRRVAGDCTFYRDGSCQVYAERPWICRTYPFMLDGEDLLTFPCPGLGSPIGKEEARALARDLRSRQAAEEEEGEKIRQAISALRPVDEGCLVVDGEGVTRV